MPELMIGLKIRILKNKVANKIRRKFGWYEYECADCNSIYDRFTGRLLDGYGVYGIEDGKHICKICKQKRHEKNDKLKCPICHKDTVYKYDWDFLGEFAHFKCKTCKVIFLGSHSLWNYDIRYLKTMNDIVDNIDNLLPALRELERRYNNGQEKEEEEATAEE